MKRRSLFKAIAAGSLTAAHPLACLLARNAMAQSESAPIRTIFLFHPDGCNPEIFFPAAGSSVLPAQTSPLQGVYDNLVFIDGLAFSTTTGGGGLPHPDGNRKCLTGQNTGAESSIDVLMGREDWENRQSNGIRVPTVQFNVGNDSANDGPSIDNGKQTQTNTDPRSLYSRLFGAANGDPTQADNLYNRLLSAAQSDLAVIRANLGNIDGQRDKLDIHADALAALEFKFSSPALNAALPGCKVPDIGLAPTFGDSISAWRAAEVLPLASDIQQDLAIATLGCGITKSIVFAYGSSLSQARVPTSYINDHDASHSSAEVFTLSKKWWMGEVAQFIKKLAATPDSNGSLLDNTVLVTVSDIGYASHEFFRIPTFIASGVNNNVGLVTGRSLDWRKSSQRIDVQLNGYVDLGAGLTRDIQAISHTDVLETIRQVAGYNFTMPESNGGMMPAWTAANDVTNPR
jgi:hypothetical protein